MRGTLCITSPQVALSLCLQKILCVHVQQVIPQMCICNLYSFTKSLNTCICSFLFYSNVTGPQNFLESKTVSQIIGTLNRSLNKNILKTGNDVHTTSKEHEELYSL
jgi:hypothetical protein